jgi:hypothetical protein
MMNSVMKVRKRRSRILRIACISLIKQLDDEKGRNHGRNGLRHGLSAK